MTTKEEISLEIAGLAIMRDQFEKVYTEYKMRMEELQNDERLKGLKEKVDLLREEIEVSEEGIKNKSIEIFEKTKNADIHPAITIKQFKVPIYKKEEAIEYCTRYLPRAINLNTREFEKVAKTAELSFVIIKTESRAQIKKDLTSYIG